MFGSEKITELGKKELRALKDSSLRYALDMGSHSIKALSYKEHSGKVDLLGAKEISFKEIFDYTTEPEKRKDLLKEALLKLFPSEKIREKIKVSLTLPSSAIFIRLSTLPRIRGKAMRQAVKYEVQEKMPCPLEELVWDYLVLPQKKGKEISVSLVAVRREIIEDIFGVAKEIGIQIDKISAGPSAIYEAVRSKLKDSETVLVIDLGAKTTDVIAIQRNGFWSRTITYGALKLIEALSPNPEAPIQVSSGKEVEVLLDNPENQEILNRELKTLAGEIERTLTIYHQEVVSDEFRGFVLLGGLTRLEQIHRYFQAQLKIPTWKPFKDKYKLGEGVLQGVFFQAASITYSSESSMNLIPDEERNRRTLRHFKWAFKIYSFLLVILLALGLGCLGVELAGIKGREAKLQKEITYRKGLKNQIDSRLKKIELWKMLFMQAADGLYKKSLPVKIIRELEANLPEAVWLEKVTFNDFGNEFILEGRMRDKLSGIMRLREALESSELFNKISAQGGYVEADGSRHFVCQVEVKP